MTSRRARVRAGFSSFSTVTDVSDGHWRLILTEIRLPSACLDFGCESSHTDQLSAGLHHCFKKASLKSVLGFLKRLHIAQSTCSALPRLDESLRLFA